MFKKSSLSKTLALILSASLLVGNSAYSDPRKNLFELEKDNLRMLSEYVYGNEVEQKMMPVYLLGAVRNPGLYHLPQNTDLTTLLSIAGGPSLDSNINDVTIRGTEKVQNLDFEEVIRSPSSHPFVLKPRDVVWVPIKQPVVHNNTMVVLALVTGVLTAVVLGFVVRNELRRP